MTIGKTCLVSTFAILFIALVAAPVTADQAAVGNLIEAIETMYRSVAVVQADFTQISSSAALEEERQQGYLVLKRPSMMKWHFTSGSQFVTNGTTMWIYTRTDNQVIQYDNFSTEALAPGFLLQSLHRLGELFEVELVEKTRAQSVLKLTPRDQTGTIVLILDADLLVSHVSITNANGQTRLDFQNVRLNGSVPDSTFHFNIPAGAEVISAGGL